MGEVFRVGVRVALLVGLVHVQKFGEKLHGRLRPDIQGFHDRQGEGRQELAKK